MQLPSAEHLRYDGRWRNCISKAIQLSFKGPFGANVVCKPINPKDGLGCICFFAAMLPVIMGYLLNAGGWTGDLSVAGWDDVP